MNKFAPIVNQYMVWTFREPFPAFPQKIREFSVDFHAIFQ